MLQRPDERRIGDSSTAAIKKSNKDQAPTRVLDDTSNGTFKPGVGYLDVVFPKLCRQQLKNDGEMLRRGP